MLNLRFQIGKELRERDQLDHWLTERYILYQDSADRLSEFEIHHIRWPLHHLNLSSSEINYSRFSDILTNFPNRMHYSPGVQVLAWGKNGLKNG